MPTRKKNSIGIFIIMGELHEDCILFFLYIISFQCEIQTSYYCVNIGFVDMLM